MRGKSRRDGAGSFRGDSPLAGGIAPGGAPGRVGGGAVFSCDGATNSTDCKFNYNYTAPSSGGNAKLLVRHWQDKGKGSGTTLKETFHGDIATS